MAHRGFILSFRELEPFARALLAVFFPFMLARIPGQKSQLFELGSKL